MSILRRNFYGAVVEPCEQLMVQLRQLGPRVQTVSENPTFRGCMDFQGMERPINTDSNDHVQDRIWPKTLRTLKLNESADLPQK